MSALEVNKIFASFLLAIILLIVINFVGDLIVDKENNELLETAYKIEIDEVESLKIDSSKSELVSEPISPLLASASIENGEKIYKKKCSSCHNFEKNSANKIGPVLWDVINRPKANIIGFAYSKALSEFGGKWGFEEISEFLYKPKDYVKNGKMNFAGLKKIEDRADLIIFLRQQSDNPIELP
tara:strand:+ start:72 stop:620 length:549 start_codon:yes stop_codon:yes gene_type:complete